jgi:ankyrin repeat protein
LRSNFSLLFLSSVCCLWAWAPLPTLHAQKRDVRLLEAVKRRDQKAFTALLQAKADVNAAQPDGATALAWAVHLGQRSMAMALLDSGANANTADEYGETPVTLAAANGDAGLVQRLIAAGGNARAARWNGETTLMIAAGAGSLETVQE